MKKTGLIFLAIGIVFVLFLAPSCSEKKSSPAGPAAAGGTGTISGTLTNLSTTNVSTYGVLVLSNLSGLSAPVNEWTSTSPFASSPYSLTAAAGTTYYAVAVELTMTAGGYGYLEGVYGATFPAFPLSPNAAVTQNGVTNNINITLEPVMNSISGTLTLPAAATTSTGYYVIYTQAPPGSVFVDGNSSFSNKGVTEYSNTISSGTTCTYSMPIFLPGPYYIEAYVDNDNSGTISSGDYVGSLGPITVNPANSLTNENIVLTTQP